MGRTIFGKKLWEKTTFAQKSQKVKKSIPIISVVLVLAISVVLSMNKLTLIVVNCFCQVTAIPLFVQFSQTQLRVNPRKNDIQDLNKFRHYETLGGKAL